MKSTISSRLQQLLDLSWDDWKILFAILLVLPLTALALRTKGFMWTYGLLRRNALQIKSAGTSTDLQLGDAKRVVYLTNGAVNNGAYPANCLEKSLVVWWILLRRGIDAELMIGVNRNSEEFNAHAWVEYKAHVLTGPVDVGAQYSAFSDSLVRGANID